MMFDLKRPCVNCPFRKGVGERFQLSARRLEEIRRSVAFQCHKTINYDNFDDPRKRQGERPQQCAGLMTVLKREEAENGIMSVAQRIGGVDLSDLDPEDEAYATWDEVLAAHGSSGTVTESGDAN